MISYKHQKTEKNRDTKRNQDREKLDKEKQHQLQLRHHKRHRRNERKDCDINAPTPPKILKLSHPLTPPPPEISRSDASLGRNSSSQLSSSVLETNELHATLGLKPLEVNNATHQDTANTTIKDDFGDFYHKPVPNITKKAESQMLKERLTVHKEKRRIKDGSAKVRTYEIRKLQGERRRAKERRAKMLDQIAEELCIGNLVKEDIHSSCSKVYNEEDLKGTVMLDLALSLLQATLDDLDEMPHTMPHTSDCMKCLMYRKQNKKKLHCQRTLICDWNQTHDANQHMKNEALKHR